MARKPKHEEHENHERWLVSYADFITLLFAFFVVMYSLSSLNEGKYRVLSESLIAAFKTPTRSIEPISVGEPMRSPHVRQQAETMQVAARAGITPPVPVFDAEQRRQQQIAEAQAKLDNDRAQTLAQIAADLEKALAPLILKDLVHVRRTRTWMEVEINTSILFPSGSAQLTPSAFGTLEKVAGILKPYPNPIHVEGFTDNRPIKTVAFPSNWELSAARAASVVHLFSRAGIRPERLAAIGYGEHHPVADNGTAEGRNANRRVTLVVLADPSARRLRDQVGGPDAAVAPTAGPDVPAATTPVPDATPAPGAPS
jgi:chemotaxis protein MotB